MSQSSLNDVIGRPYPETTMFGAIAGVEKEKHRSIAYDFMGKEISYKDFITKTEQAAAAFLSAVIGKNDVVTICMPNCPQAVIYD